ncbi:MAG: hypothetical protein AAGD92_13300 [Pseudomonadota bacterium]
MTQNPHKPDSLDQDTVAAVTHCYHAYGGDFARWPEEARNAFSAIAKDEAFADVRKEALLIDAALDEDLETKADEALQDRILNDFSAKMQHRSPSPDIFSVSLFDRIVSVLAKIKPLPAAALAGIGAIGFAYGAVAGAGAGWAPEYEAYAYLGENNFADLTEDGEASWVVD